MMPRGMMVMMKTGVAKQIMKRVLIIPRKYKIQLRKDTGRVSSIVEISPANLFTIRPEGVVSKNPMGARRILFSSCL